MREKEIDYLHQCLALEKKFEVAPKLISYELASRSINEDVKVGVRDVAATTAFQCYARGEAVLRPRPEENAQKTLDSTLEAGHHTTRMHTNFTWKMMVSRYVVHDFFHNFPYYNTSQQSQRYVEIKNGNFLVPPGLTDSQKELFLRSAQFANDKYFEMLPMLEPEITRRMHEIYSATAWQNLDRKAYLKGKAEKLSQEVARYVLPINQFTILDYTLNELQLLRLFRASLLPNVSDEARYMVAKMIESVSVIDPQIIEELQMPIEAERDYGQNEKYIIKNKNEFDDILGGKSSKLLNYDQRTRTVVAMAVRNVLGFSREEMSDKEALSRLMDPVKNPLLADVFDSGINDPLTQCLRLINFNNAVRLSHAGDSQRQRHRTIPGVTPPMESIFDGEVDCFQPMVVRGSQQLLDFFDKTMATEIENVNRCLESGISKREAILLVPNSYNIRLIETGDGLDYLHRRKLRLCSNAQEEIFFMDLEQTRQTLEVFPEMKKMLMAPCGLRKITGQKPFCPEGERYCGQPMWNFDIIEYKQKRIV